MLAGPIYTYYQHLSLNLPVENYAQPNCFDEDSQPYVELYFDPGMAKCVMDDASITQNDFGILRIYLQDAQKKSVIERDTDLLTPAEVKQHKSAVDAAILEEIKIWVKYKTFTRWPRRGNVMTSRYVFCLLYTSPSPRDRQKSRMPSSA